MKDDNKDKKAEDILTDELLAEALIKGTLDRKLFREEELRFAEAISQATGSGKQNLESGQKNQLGNRISQSISNAKRKRTLIWMSSAAAVLILTGLTFIFQLDSRSDIRNYASGISLKADSEYTRLLLSGKKEIHIESQESQIKYSENGKEVKIDDRRKVEQQAERTNNQFNTVIVPYGKRTRITLSDNSTIHLNSGSKLIYPAKFDGDKREVYLEGEAVFEVKHDVTHPFCVITRDLEVKVLGTVFDLSAYNDDKTVNTVLESGSVELRYKGNSWLGFSKEIMVPGMLAVFDPAGKTISQTKVKTRNYMSWKDGFLVLENTTLETIVKQLSRYYNVSISFESPELAAETFSGDLDLQNSPVQVLDLIAETMDIEIMQVDHQIKIKKRLTAPL